MLKSRRHKYTALIILVQAFLLVGFQNCSKIKASDMDKSSQSGSDVETGNGGAVGIRCAEGNPQTRSFNIRFEEPPRCDWGNNGNLSPLNNWLRARQEQNVEFSLPAGATICDLKMTFEPQNFRFDDNIILTLNDRLLMTSFDWQDSFQKDSAGFSIYDWSRIKGAYWGGNETDRMGTFCMTANGMARFNGNSQICHIPESQENGTIKLAFEKTLIQQLINSTGIQSSNSFGFITTGDNDNDDDCFHKEIRYDLEVTYVE